MEKELTLADLYESLQNLSLRVESLDHGVRNLGIRMEDLVTKMMLLMDAHVGLAARITTIEETIDSHTEVLGVLQETMTDMQEDLTHKADKEDIIRLENRLLVLEVR